MKAIVKGSSLLADCFLVFVLAISPFRPEAGERE
jgi:hypothetical protein